MLNNIAALILAFLIALCYKYRSHAPGAHPRPDLKEPKGAVPLLGHLLVVASYPGAKLYDFFEKQNKELGPVWSISLPILGRLILGDDPNVIEHVLKTNFPNYIRGELLTSLLKDVIGRGDFNVLLRVKPYRSSLYFIFLFPDQIVMFFFIFLRVLSDRR